MSATARGEDRRRFTPTSGTTAGWVGVGLAVFVLVVILLDDQSLPTVRFAFAVAIFGLLAWCYLLRPRVVIDTAEVELRNAFSSWHVPLADVRRVAVRAVTRVYTDERRFDGVAIGRPVRSLRRGHQPRQAAVGIPGLGATRTQLPEPPARQSRGHLDADGVADYVVEQILLAADRARAGEAAPRTARRSWAWLELVGLVSLLVGLVVALLA